MPEMVSPDTISLQHLEGRLLGGNRLIRWLGRGGMAAVYYAEQERLGRRPVAVKVVQLEDLTTLHGKATSHDIATQFLHEGKLLARLSHPNILPVHDSGEEHGLLYLVMQYVPAGSLAAALRGQAPRGARAASPMAHASRTLLGLQRLQSLPLDVPLAVMLLTQVAVALQYIHNHGIVHRDVKPANILLGVEPDGSLRPMLADFGIATRVEVTAHFNELAGTVAYMAPEQVQGYVTPASDQYALGVMAYLLLTGRTPFEGGIAEQLYAHVHAPVLPVRAYNPAVPLEVAEAVMRALAKRPEDRHPSAGAFAWALRAGVEPESAPTIVGAAIATAATSATSVTPVQTAPENNPTLTSRTLQPHSPAIFSNATPAKAGGKPQTNTTQRTTEGVTQPSGKEADEEHALPPHGPTGGERTTGGALGRDRLPTKRKLGLLAVCLGVLVLAIVVDLGSQQHGFLTAGSSNGDALRSSGQTAQTPTVATGVVQTPTAGSSANPTATVQQGPSSDAAGVVSVLPSQLTVQPGQQFTVELTLRNTGTSTWIDAGNYALTCDTMRHPDSSCTHAMTIGIGGSPIVPGHQVRFSLALTAPASLGTYTLWLDMEHEGILFNSPDAQVVLRVRQSPPTPQPAPAPTPTATPQPTSTATPAATATPIPTPTPQPTSTASPAFTPTPIPTATSTP